MEWKDYFRNIVHEIKKKSKDERTQIGALIVGEDNQILSSGYNSFPRGINDNVPERQERPEKYYWFSHAETNAIVNAARTGVSTIGTTIYLTCDICCCDCARNIINAGITEIVFTKGGGAVSSMWDEHAKRSIQMFHEANIKISYFD